MKQIIFVLTGVFSSTAFAYQPAWQPATDCRANIAAVTCHVSPMSDIDMKDGGVNRPCKGDEQMYVEQIQRAYDEIPAKVQQAFCHMRKIFIEEQFYATAYTSLYTEFYEENGKKYAIANGFVMGMNVQNLFALPYDMTEWMNRKEQTIFGRRMDEPLLIGQVPQFTYVYSGFQSDFKLVDVMTHEIGHMMDMANQLNQIDYMYCMDQTGKWKSGCQPPVQGAWAMISWKSDGSYRAEDSAFGGKPPCYYGCDAKDLLDLAQAVPLYQSWIDSNAWISPYAANNVMDDLAESFTFYSYQDDVKAGRRNVDLTLTFPDGKTDSMMELAKRGHLQAKFDYMRLFYNMEWKYDFEMKPEPVPPSGRVLVPIIPCDL
jgi:hypothetical protein